MNTDRRAVVVREVLAGGIGARKGNQMNPEDAAIVAEVNSAIQALNAAIFKAREAQLEVRLDSIVVQTFGHEMDHAIYSAVVSKQAFSQRVG